MSYTPYAPEEGYKSEADLVRGARRSRVARLVLVIILALGLVLLVGLACSIYPIILSDWYTDRTSRKPTEAAIGAFAPDF